MLNLKASKLILLCDQDGILADFERHSLRMYNQRMGTTFDEDKCYEFVGSHIIIEPTINQKQYRKPFSEPGFFLGIPPIKNSQEAIEKLLEFFDIYIVTTEYRGNQTCAYEKQKWLQIYFPKIADNIIVTKHKELVYGDILVDDRPENLQKWSDSWGGLGTVKTASLEYHWINKEITSFYDKDWLLLADKIIQHFSKGEPDGEQNS
jgi:5'(3')-deoxyribonucleotidase